jgi:predicted DNA-binding transcriptional regulator YafY
MRASRLLAILMLLQSHRRMSATALAAEVEVSVRTIYRDIEQLSAAGVPVTVLRGASGGFELLDGWRTRLTGLTPHEAQAIFMAGVPGPASELGLGPSMASAQLKLLAALPSGWQADARRVSSRFHLDPVGWYQSAARADTLPAIAEAVWNERRVKIRYESWQDISDRVIEPLGLVLKAGEWYVVATSPGKQARTYRLSSIHHLEAGGEKFARPRQFDLPQHWTKSLQRFETERHRSAAMLRASPTGLKWLRRLSAAVAEAADRTAGAVDADGWQTVMIPIESIEHAASILIRLGPEAEVLEPKALRQLMATTAQRLAELYAKGR